MDGGDPNGSSLRGWDRGGLGEAILDPRPLQAARPDAPLFTAKSGASGLLLWFDSTKGLGNRFATELTKSNPKQQRIKNKQT